MPRPSLMRIALLFTCCVTAPGAVRAQVPDPKSPSGERERPRFSWQHLNPPVLQFGCYGTSDAEEEALAKLLEKGEPHQQQAAARELWEGHSRRQAANVIKYLVGPAPGGEGFRKLQREVDAALKPQAVLRELKEGDYLWGTWLAFLRPHEELVPTLLAGLKDKPPRELAGREKGKSEFFAETMLALGNSGDARALGPLLELLKSDDYRIAGDAANALGYLGNGEAELRLIEALGGDNNWRQVQACGALAKFGTRKALPALEKLAKDDRYTGALNVKGAAENAIQRITKREKR
ncbi:HEAT repeat domain-containing protein [Gemmata sp. JC673]|uniref:HEAT repeat domain-containing protein n=1 Tax=Gemmata algarum TaxID=2975278 RepID=A0ABU5EUA2_9BACT|nr:HEAT repeat domain-containing protein [Gemmata algarum]MDY3558544.1 HEAT repeat domain-containing protein [Gemmata algarum]